MQIQGGPLPLLFNHRSDRPAGRIEQIERTSDSIVIDALIVDDDVWRLIRSGSITGTSIGFQPLSWDEDDVHDGVLVCRSWNLIEISIVATPANPDARVEEIRSIAQRLEQELFPMPPFQQPARPDPRTDPALAAPRLVDSRPAGGPAVHTARAQRYDVGKVLRSMMGDAPLDGVEREVAVELERRSGPAPTRGVRIPSAIFKRQVSTAPGSIGALSPTQYVGQLLDDMSQARRWGSLLQRCGFVTFNSTRETVAIPKRDSRVVASWGPKDAAASESDWTAQDDTLQPRYVKAWVPIERSALRYADPSALQLTLADLGDAIDAEADTGLLFGDGTNDVPIGLLRAPGRVVDMAGASAISTDFMDLKNTLLEQWRKDDPDGVRWVMNARSWDALRITSKKQSGSGEEWMSGLAPFDAMESVLLNIAVIQSGKVTVSATANAYPIYLVYGAMGVVVWFGGGSIDTIVDSSTLSTRGAVRVSGFLDCNAVVRDPHIVHAMINVLAAPPAVTPAPLAPAPVGRGRAAA
jgi:HK97 family phage major capsid protein